MPVVSWLAHSVKKMWLAEHVLHSDSGYLPKELMVKRDRLSDKQGWAQGKKKNPEVKI